ncbi:hypothetical protein Moror_1827 [Moniliophthora roreri MCA 2997]|uniref:Uncharacterized protein n=2 Tax=Moniliophthora roreri TaxID=221103 RepID=V2X4N4_MONRO|nr:hypothetical protein Moror_1827 [Moniliophthora roreri MCA 2997]KAI3605524.1 hypothetical protein WG66_005871 [Moniliophthora roreri]
MARFSSVFVAVCIAIAGQGVYAAPMNHVMAPSSANATMVHATTSASATVSSVAPPAATIVNGGDAPPAGSNSTDASLCNVSRAVFITDLIDFAQIVQLIDASAQADNADQTTLSTIQDAKQGIQDAASAAFTILAAAIVGEEPPANALNDTATGLVNAGNALTVLAQDNANGVDKNAIVLGGLKLIDLGNAATAIEQSC